MKHYFTFGLLGSINTILAYAIFALLTYFGAAYPLALFFDYILGSIIGVFLHHRYTFQPATQISRYTILQSIILNVFLFLINVFILYLFVDMLHLNPYLAQILALFIIIMSSYIGFKYIITRTSQYDRK